MTTQVQNKEGLSEERLRECPFCGNADRSLLDLIPPVYDDENPSLVIGPAHVHCSNCGAMKWGDDFDEESAFAAWNRRAASAQVEDGDRVAQARMIVDAMLERDDRNGVLNSWWRNRLDLLAAALVSPATASSGPVAWESQSGDGRDCLFYAKERAELQVEVDGKGTIRPLFAAPAQGVAVSDEPLAITDEMVELAAWEIDPRGMSELPSRPARLARTRARARAALTSALKQGGQ